MKTVEKVSIAEISFTLDSDAYLALKQYLDSLHDYYDKDPDGREIIADIEARIAELILGEQIYTKVVSRSLVDRIIAQLGTPEEIDDKADESFSTFSGDSAGAAGTTSGSIPRRLHRSEEGKLLGGVCSGIAKYFDISVAWVRIAFLLPMLLSMIVTPFHAYWFHNVAGGWSWAFFMVYMVLWVALPMAKTPRQKLEARGEKITPESIRQNLQGAVTTPAGKKAASVAAELVNVLGRVVLFFVKFVTAIVGFSFLFAAIALFMAMVFAFFHPASTMVANNVDIVTMFDGMTTPVLFVMLILFCAMMPLFVIGMALLSFTFSWRLGRIFYAVTLGSWGFAMIFCGFVAARDARFFRDTLPDRIENISQGDYDRNRPGSSSEDEGAWHSAPGRVTIRRDSTEFDTLQDSSTLNELHDSIVIPGTSGTAEGGRVEIRRTDK